MRGTLPDRVRLGTFEIDLRAGEVRDGVRALFLQEQPLAVLRLLVEQGGGIVLRDEIKRRLWPNDTVVDFDLGVNASIWKLRQAFGDSADEPRYIGTIARRGYRLLVPVEAVEPAKEIPVASQAKPLPEKAQTREPSAAHLVGQKVSHYRVLEVIGGGGMGMVYKAEDLKLGREVALKFLPPELATDPVALQRFEREARAASSLDHPNICTIHEVGEHDSQPFIVMQLLHGETLRDRMSVLAADHKGLSLQELLDIAVQICGGLQAAHAKGIIHRDIKPANIFLTTSGQVKILDFGVAKLTTAIEQPEVDELPMEVSAQTAAARPAKPVPLDTTLTRLGVALGTAGYMSPEQVRGEKLDARTDIFSFGLVIYGMATGQRAFHGETAAIVHNAILHTVPVPARQLNPDLPGQLEAILDKALEKEREKRYQSAADVSQDLTQASIRFGTRSGAAGWKRWAAWLAAAALLALIAIVIARSIKPKAAPAREVREQQITANPLDNPLTGAAISPDGKYVAYYDMTGLYLRPVDSGESRPISLPPSVGGRLHISWLPDGRNLLADAVGVDGWNVWLIPVVGTSQPQLLYKHAVYPAISPDGRSIVFLGYEGMVRQGTEIWVGDLAGSKPRSLIAAAENEHFFVPAWSPDGRWIAYGRKWKSSDGSSLSAIEARPAGGGSPRTLVAESSLPNSFRLLGGVIFTAGWFRDWRVLFSAYAGGADLLAEGKYSLWQAKLDPNNLELVGEPERLIEASELAIGYLTIAANGKRATILKSRTWVDVYVGELDADGSRMQTPIRLTQDDRGSALDGWTRDSRAVLFNSNRSGRREIFQQGVSDRLAENIPTTDQSASFAQMSPDGKWLLYETDDASGNATSIMRRPSEGGASEKLLDVTHSGFDEFWCSWNVRADPPCVLGVRNGHDLVFYSLDPIRGKGGWLGKIGVTEPPGGLYDWGLSPDGSTLAVVDSKFGSRIKLFSLRDRNWRDLPIQTNQDRLHSIGWAAHSKSFFLCSQSGDSFNLLHVTSDGKVQQLFRTRVRAPFNPIASPDGRHLAFQIQEFQENVWMIENF